MESPGGGFRMFSRRYIVHHSAYVMSLFKDILKTQQTLTRDGLGGLLPGISPLKEGETWRLSGPFQNLSKSVGRNTTSGAESELQVEVFHCQPNQRFWAF